MNFDFIIAGGGIAGVSLADALAPRARVCLLESEPQLGYHSTARSAALFAPAYGSRLFRCFSRASTAFLHKPDDECFPATVLSPRGALHIARGDQLQRLDAEVADIRASGIGIETLSFEQARALVPVLRETYVAGSALESEVHDIDVDGLFQGFLRRARRSGVHVLSGTGEEAFARRDGLWQVSASAQAVAAPVLIVAAGAWSDQLGQRLGARPLGLQVLRRSAAIVDAPAGVEVGAWPAVFDVEDEFYFKPDAGRLLISPADEEPVAPGDAYTDEISIATAVERIQAAADLEVTRVRREWAGLRTFAADRNPVIGYDGEVEGLFFSVAQGGYGIQTAPAYAQTAAALALGEPVPEPLLSEGVTAEVLSPQRLRTR
ncbi:MAG: FAD-binding oxidoreductase [Proteobacteria bacterium]|nr:FAD-binding oxidoreductase [Pseudomonadota bacterium]